LAITIGIVFVVLLIVQRESNNVQKVAAKSNTAAATPQMSEKPQIVSDNSQAQLSSQKLLASIGQQVEAPVPRLVEQPKNIDDDFAMPSPSSISGLPKGCMSP
jgi:hypothetical protein